jgi:ribosomal protein S18 acetylase RimI-like enzyme
VSEPRAATAADVPAVAALHAERISEGFLPTLGSGFLERLYGRMVRSDTARVFVVDDDTNREDAYDVVGFVATAGDTGRFYREFLRHDGFAAAWHSAGALARSPRKVWETFHYGTRGADGNADAGVTELPAAEVFAIAVAPRVEGRGLGAALLAAALDGFRADGVSAARVVTAVGNEAAQRMYERAGFRAVSRTEVHAGVPQEVLVWP